MAFDFDAAVLAVDVQCIFIRCLKLRHRVTDHHRTMAGSDVHRVLNRDAFESLMRRIAIHPCAGSEQPLDGIREVRERILNDAAAGLAACVVDLAIGRTKGGEVLAGDGGGLEHATDLTGLQKCPRLLNPRHEVVHIRHSDKTIRRRNGRTHLRHERFVNRERLFDEDMQTAPEQSLRHRQMQMRRRADHRRVVGGGGERFIERGKARRVVAFPHRGEQCGVRIAGSDGAAASLLKAA